MFTWLCVQVLVLASFYFDLTPLNNAYTPQYPTTKQPIGQAVSPVNKFLRFFYKQLNCI